MKSKLADLTTRLLIPALAAFLFFWALVWAQSRDPFRRHWFKVMASSGDEVACVAAFPKPPKACPVVLYLHDEGGSIKTDGRVLRQLAELGLTAISLDYNQTNDTQFEKQFSSVIRRVKHEGWAGTNAMAWIGEGIGTRHAVQFLLKNPIYKPLVLAGIGRSDFAVLPEQNKNQASQAGLNSRSDEGVLRDSPKPLQSAVSLVFVGEREMPGPRTARLIQCLSNSIATDLERQALLHPRARKAAPCEVAVSVNLTNIVLARDSLLINRELVLRELGECCKRQLMPQFPAPEFSNPPKWPFLALVLPLIFCGGIVLGKRRLATYRFSNLGLLNRPVVSLNEEFRINPNFVGQASSRAEPVTEAKRSSQHKMSTLAVVSFLAGALAVILLVWHAVLPNLTVTESSLRLARLSVAPSTSKEDFEWLASLPVWRTQKMSALLSHAELAHYTVYKLVNWTMPTRIYQDYVLSPIIDADKSGVNWRRPLWEYLYPRIRKENTTKAAATIVVRQLRQRVTISPSVDKSDDLEAIWNARIADEKGFERLYVAALRSVGVPARLNVQEKAEYWDGQRWSDAPQPVLDTIPF